MSAGQNNQANEAREANNIQDWDPRTMLNNLSVLENKIHQLQDLVHVIVGRRSLSVGPSDEQLVHQQQQLLTADLTSIIVQLISTAGSLLPSAKNSYGPESSIGQLAPFAGIINPPEVSRNFVCPNYNTGNAVEDRPNTNDPMAYVSSAHGSEQIEDHEMKTDDEAEEGENLPPGSYEILQLEKEEILAPHTHFCTICGKGFKRDANLRMHMRGHGDEYKTPAALAKPHKESSSEPILIKSANFLLRFMILVHCDKYSCPYGGCKRNKEHKKFQPLKTILCVKNHYKRTHCDKNYTCSRCNTKKFSVIADLKTHEKHCGRDKWLCSCGTTFSRKDKLFGHIALFQGHTPAIPVEESKVLDQGQSSGTTNKVEQLEFKYNADVSAYQNAMDIKGSVDDPSNCFSPLGFDMSCGIGGFQEFPRPPYEDSENAFEFLLSGSCDYPQKNVRYNGSDNME